MYRTDPLNLLRYGGVMLVLAAPAAAFAAEPARAPALKGVAPALLSVKDNPLVEARKKAERDRILHPVAGKVGYGDAQAAFGNARGRPHEGQDVFAPAGTKLVAPREVVVVETGSDGGRGNWAALYDREKDATYSYFHMLGAAEVEVGQKLKGGEKVGEVGCTGSCWGDHLHFEIREGKGPYGAARDPMPFLDRATRADN